VDMQERVAEMHHYVTEDVQKRQEYVGQVMAAVMAVCALKAAGVALAGVLLVQHVGVVLRQTTGAKQSTTDIAVLFVIDVQTAGKVLHMVATQTEKVSIVVLLSGIVIRTVTVQHSIILHFHRVCSQNVEA